ncbi:unnamed protein product [Gulo gulo]|uniref:Uncharacterized protein n=1 Tax=Gulo gulo TaxID=48420 RepID=A0A9X9LP17_GULGU|nr:unnamed protein product [Gulo gulo]
MNFNTTPPLMRLMSSLQTIYKSFKIIWVSGCGGHNRLKASIPLRYIPKCPTRIM